VVTKPLACAVARASACIAALAATSCTLAAESLADSLEWPTYGHDPGGMRYAPLSDIDASNVGRLELAWTYHMRPEAGQAAPAAAAGSAEDAAPSGAARPRYSASQATPLVVDGLMFLSTPYRRVVALDAEDGREVWAYDVAGPGQPSLRGVEYWPGDAAHGPRVLFGTRDGRLIALDAKSGNPALDFASRGVLDLKTPEVRAAPAVDRRAQ
jgi:quinoprotein glucose dehydrogenase